MVSNFPVGSSFTSNSHNFEGTYDFQHFEVLTIWIMDPRITQLVVAFLF